MNINTLVNFKEKGLKSVYASLMEYEKITDLNKSLELKKNIETYHKKFGPVLDELTASNVKFNPETQMYNVTQIYTENITGSKSSLILGCSNNTTRSCIDNIDQILTSKPHYNTVHNFLDYTSSFCDVIFSKSINQHNKPISNTLNNTQVDAFYESSSSVDQYYFYLKNDIIQAITKADEQIINKFSKDIFQQLQDIPEVQKALLNLSSFYEINPLMTGLMVEHYFIFITGITAFYVNYPVIHIYSKKIIQNVVTQVLIKNNTVHNFSYFKLLGITAVTSLGVGVAYPIFLKNFIFNKEIVGYDATRQGAILGKLFSTFLDGFTGEFFNTKENFKIYFKFLKIPFTWKN